jgi:hypothetical protein
MLHKKSLNNNSFATIDMQPNLVSISMKIENDYKKKNHVFTTTKKWLRNIYFLID